MLDVQHDDSLETDLLDICVYLDGFYLLFMLLFIYLCCCHIYIYIYIYINALATLCYTVMLIKLLNWIELRHKGREIERERERNDGTAGSALIKLQCLLILCVCRVMTVCWRQSVKSELIQAEKKLETTSQNHLRSHKSSLYKERLTSAGVDSCFSDYKHTAEN